ncbi:MAG TPA: hypothetical protein VFA37_10455 [Gaiellaceae bacterium]|nr:hypothetical protein [Gaiellaceae bacterium]
MSDRTEAVAAAYTALNNGDVSVFRELFAPDAQWLAVPGSGFDGETPT